MIEEFVKQKFAEYYRDNPLKIQPPASMEKREFGFLLFKERVMIRHKAFKRPAELRRFIESTAPSDIYYSAAYYERPEESMESKGWLGADLVFDIDADHLQTPCRAEHNYWICEGCKNIGRGLPPQKCPRCGGNKFKEETWLCEKCLEAAKTETLKLMDFLTDDFGFSVNDVNIYFSGQRGYHVHIENEDVRQLDQLVRKEIVDYVLGTGLKIEFHGLRETGRERMSEIVGPDLHSPGWQGRLARGTYDFMASATPKQMEEIEGIKKGTAKTIIAHKDKLLEAWEKKAPWGAVRGIGIQTWKKIARRAIEKQAANVDTVVTTDIHRLIRLPETLHGKTGLRKLEVPVKRLEIFDPLSEAVAFDKGTLRVYVKEAFQFKLGEGVYGPYKKETVGLPMAVAMLLLLKHCAKLA